MIPASPGTGALNRWADTFGKINRNKEVIAAGLSIAEKEVRGGTANTIDWANVAVAATAGPPGVGQYTTSVGGWNWKGIATQAAVRGAASIIVGQRRSTEEGANFFGAQIGNLYGDTYAEKRSYIKARYGDDGIEDLSQAQMDELYGADLPFWAREEAARNVATVGNALGNSIVDKTTSGDSAAARRAKFANSDDDSVTTAGVLSDSERALLQSIGDEGEAAMQRNLDAFTQQGLDELARRPAPMLSVAQDLSNNPQSTIRSGSNVSPDKVKSKVAEIGPNSLRAGLVSNVSNGTGAYRNENGTLVIPITGGANDLPSQAEGYGSASWNQGLYLAGPVPAANFDLGPLSLTVNGAFNAVNSVANGILNGVGEITAPFVT